ncbi:MAG: tetratricopeptide repeat protein [Paracoccaceae bacterium]
MAAEVLRSLDLLVLFDDHHETFSTHTIPEATGMNRITFVLATVLSLPFTPLAAQDFQKGLAAAQAGDFATTLQEWTPLAEAGSARTQNALGYMYENGYGVPQDYAEAVRLYRLAADQGDANAQYNLGFMYENGQGVLQDNVMAHMWYNIGAANGNELGGEQRDSIAEGMTQQAIEQAQQMARDCMGSGYQNCGY